MAHEQLLCEARIAGVLAPVFNVVHALDKKLFSDAQRLAEVEGIEASALLVHHHHNVVGGLVIHQQFAVTVGNGATRRILYLFQKRVTVGVLLIVVAHQLERKQAHQINEDDDNSHTANDVTSVLKVVILHLLKILLSIIYKKL